MSRDKTIIVTGAAGFIGSCLLSRLNEEGFDNILITDHFTHPEKNKNLRNKDYSKKIDRDEFLQWFRTHSSEVAFVFHIGARTDTTEFNKAVFDALNLNYSKEIWKICSTHGIPLVYASSAATYGLGEYGYDDKHEIIPRLKPLNPYGDSKNDFDKWVLKQEERPPFWAGLKFFNVYGPNEYHKGRMASVVFHAFHQIREKGSVKLFRSHHPAYKDGEQLRDFVYVKDVTDVCYFLMKNTPAPGIYNLGSGKARTFHDLVKNTFKAVEKEPVIEFIDTPPDIRDKYQYFTEANMNKLRSAGYGKTFCSLEEGIHDYVTNYLLKGKFY